MVHLKKKPTTRISAKIKIYRFLIEFCATDKDALTEQAKFVFWVEYVNSVRVSEEGVRM